MEVSQVIFDYQFLIGLLSVFLGNAGLIIWFRSESRNDWKHMDQKIDAIQSEMKQFHGRLCTLEERYLQIITERK